MDHPSSLSSSGQQQRSNSNSSASSFVSPSPGSSSASVLLGPSSSVYRHSTAPRSSSLVIRRRRLSSDSKSSNENQHSTPTVTSSSSSSSNNGVTTPDSSGRQQLLLSSSPRSSRPLFDSAARAQSRSARKLNDSMVYLDGPQIYTCAQCRTHLTSHDEIISKSFHGRHGKILKKQYIIRLLSTLFNWKFQTYIVVVSLSHSSIPSFPPLIFLLQIFIVVGLGTECFSLIKRRTRLPF
jgi:hypothetical protein